MFNRHSYDSSIHSPVLTDNLNIIKRGFQIKGGGGGGWKMFSAKNLPVLELLNHFIKSSTIAYKRVAYKKHLVYGCPKQLVIVKKHQYNFSCSLHLYIKQNRTFLITILSNFNTKSCWRNQTHLCFMKWFVPSHWHVVLGVFY